MDRADASPGEGWWQAADGTWYPPELAQSIVPAPQSGGREDEAANWDSWFKTLNARVEAYWRVKARKDADESPIGASPTRNTQWLSLAETGNRFAAVISAGGARPTALVDYAIMLIKATLDIADVQSEMLQSIDENVKLLLKGPFRTGRLYLSEAQQQSARPSDATESVKSAKEKFYEAHSLVESDIDKAVVGMHIGIVSLLLDKPDDAQRWLELSYDTAIEVAEGLAAKTGDTKVLKTKWGVAAAAYFVYVAPYYVVKKHRKVRGDEWARSGLDRVLPLIECIAFMHNGLDGIPEPLMPLKLASSGDSSLGLE